MSMAFLIKIRVNPPKIANNSVTKSWIVVLWSTRRSQSSRRLTKTTTTTYRTTVLLSPKGEFSWAAEAQQLKIEGSIESPTRLLQPNKKFWKIFVFRNWIFLWPIYRNWAHPFTQTIDYPKNPIKTMGEREDNVYKAKLAEQAERYDGKLFFDVCLEIYFHEYKD